MSSSLVYQFQVNDQPFHGKIIPEKSKERVSSDKTRLGITLVKKVEDRWPQLKEKKMSQHTGWE